MRYLEITATVRGHAYGHTWEGGFGVRPALLLSKRMVRMYYIVNSGKQNYSVRLTVSTPALRAASPPLALSAVTTRGQAASAFARFAL